MGKGVVRVVVSSRGGDRFAGKPSLKFVRDAKGHEKDIINIHPEVSYQRIDGFGGALTESAAVALDGGGESCRRKVIEAYFERKEGLNYSLCRSHINSCDFSTGNYHYTERGDKSLETFSIERDLKLLVPLMRDAQKTRRGALSILSSPWSPPDWMKTTGKMNLGGKLREDCRESWAEYYSKFIDAYRKEGIAIKYLTLQNEPKAKQTWDSCIYTAEDERDFVRDHLGPSLAKNGHSGVRLLVWDHNKERVFERGRTVLSDPKAAKFVWGTAFHWYSGDHFEALSMLHESFPRKGLIFTEGCLANPRGTDWEKGEKYAHDIIGDLNNWTQGWIDWNIALDEIGGPNHVGNFCDAPVIVDTKKRKLTFKPSFYCIGHFSRYIQPGARRIGFSRYTCDLEVTAAANPDGEIVVVVMNRQNDEREFFLRCNDRLAGTCIPARAIMTLAFNP